MAAGSFISGYEVAAKCRKWVRSKLQVGCTNQQNSLIGLFTVMWLVVSFTLLVAVVGQSVKKRKEDDGRMVDY